MRARRLLLTATALIEAGAGLGLLGTPALAIRLLLGVREASPEALVVSRICGTGLLAIAIACWFARDDHGGPSRNGLPWALLVYNVGACAVLALAGATSSTTGIGLWPVVALHAAMTIGCVLSLRAADPR